MELLKAFIGVRSSWEALERRMFIQWFIVLASSSLARVVMLLKR